MKLNVLLSDSPSMAAASGSSVIFNLGIDLGTDLVPIISNSHSFPLKPKRENKFPFMLSKETPTIYLMHLYGNKHFKPTFLDYNSCDLFIELKLTKQQNKLG